MYNIQRAEDVAAAVAVDTRVFISLYLSKDKKSYGATVFRNTKTQDEQHWLCVAKSNGKVEGLLDELLDEVYKWGQTVSGSKWAFVVDSYIPSGYKSGYPVIESEIYAMNYVIAERLIAYRQANLFEQIFEFRNNKHLNKILGISPELLTPKNPFHSDSDLNLLDNPVIDLETEYPITQSFLIFANLLRY